MVILSFQSKNYYTNESLNTNILKMCIVILKGSLEQDIFITIVANNGTGKTFIKVCWIKSIIFFLIGGDVMYS